MYSKNVGCHVQKALALLGNNFVYLCGVKSLVEYKAFVWVRRNTLCMLSRVVFLSDFVFIAKIFHFSHLFRK